MIQKLLDEPLRQEIWLESEARSAASRHVDRALRKRILDQSEQHELVAHEVPWWNRELDLSLTEDLRLIQLDVLGNRVRFGERHLERWTGRFLPQLVAVDRRTPGGIVGRNRTPDHLAHEPVGVEVRRHCDRDVLADILHLLGVPQRERVVVAVRYDDRVGLE